MKRRALALFATAALGIAACGSDSSPTGDAAVVRDAAPAGDVAAVNADGGTPDTAIGDAPAAPDVPAASDVAATDTASSADVASAADSAAVCSGAIDAGAQCNALVNGASNVALVVVNTPIPTGTGGTVADGRYYLTEFKGYAGTMLKAGQMLRQTLEMCGGVGQFVSEEAGGTYHKTFGIAPMGIQPNVTQSCSTQMPNIEIPYSSYTATPTTLTFYSTVYLFSGTYTKQ